MDETVSQVTRICLLVMILLSDGGDCSPGRGSHKLSSFQGIDAVQVTRCDIVCLHRKDKKECQRECLRTPFKKFGHCPDSFDNLPVFVYACVFFCSKDSDCPATEKCCKHSCGQTCKPASGLLDEGHLPPIPANVTAKEKKKKNAVQVAWQMPPQDPDQLVLYVLEERHHLGKFYNERLFGEWTSVQSCRKTSANLKNLLRPGYWYEFRVAAVNANGTRGFSLQSEGFTFTRRPKLAKPSGLRVEEVSERNGTVWGTLRWGPSEGAVPVEKYKVFCGHRLEGESRSESVYVERASVPQHQLFYRLENLKKDTDYFIQVQAVAVFGKKSLKSKMAKMIFKTSKMEDQFEMSDFD